MQSRVNMLLFALAMLVAAAGCAPAGEHKVWRDPGYAGGPLQKVFVIGLSSTSLSDRRGFEDMMVGEILAAGGQAVPGYRFIPAGIVPDDAIIADAVARSGADGVLISRMAGLETRSNALQNPYPSLDVNAPVPAIYGGPGGGAYQVATIYTTLFAANGMHPIFTYDPKTFNPGDFEAQAPMYANLLVSTMQSNGLLQTMMLPK